MWLTLTERQSRKSRSPKAVFVFGSLRAARAGLRAAPGSALPRACRPLRLRVAAAVDVRAERPPPRPSAVLPAA